jgi:hypothetical protein
MHVGMGWEYRNRTEFLAGPATLKDSTLRLAD